MSKKEILKYIEQSVEILENLESKLMIEGGDQRIRRNIEDMILNALSIATIVTSLTDTEIETNDSIKDYILIMQTTTIQTQKLLFPVIN